MAGSRARTHARVLVWWGLGERLCRRFSPHEDRWARQAAPRRRAAHLEHGRDEASVGHGHRQRHVDVLVVRHAVAVGRHRCGAQRRGGIGKGGPASERAPDWPGRPHAIELRVAQPPEREHSCGAWWRCCSGQGQQRAAAAHALAYRVGCAASATPAALASRAVIVTPCAAQLSHAPHATRTLITPPFAQCRHPIGQQALSPKPSPWA